MPAKNIQKQYLEEGCYHIYNRGVEKRIIFKDDQDYNVFLRYLKEYLSPKDKDALLNQLTDPNLSARERNKILKTLQLNNFFGEVTLFAYCLMPNHFHLFIKQKKSTSIDTFMQSLATRYSMYFNRKYIRVGPLFQARYKALLISNEEQFLHLSRYIHRQDTMQGPTLQPPTDRQPSSLPEYLGQRKTEWVQPEEILSFFSKTNPKLSYEAFVKQVDDFDLVGSFDLDT